MEADVIPFPIPDITPPVTKRYLVNFSSRFFPEIIEGEFGDTKVFLFESIYPSSNLKIYFHFTMTFKNHLQKFDNECMTALLFNLSKQSQYERPGEC